MDNQFKQVEKEFSLLKKEFEKKEISDREFKDRLKKLRLKDDRGKCWTIGAQTGKWYYFNGSSWVESQPPSIQAEKAICIYCGYENDLENESCARCGETIDEEGPACPECGTRLDEDSKECPLCTNKKKIQKRLNEKVQDPFETKKGHAYVFRSISLFSFFIFWGVLGLLLGLILGIFVGVARDYVDAIQFFPEFLKALNGKLLGGLAFGLLGGVVGFAVLAVFGFILAVVINVILSFVGGMKIRMDKSD